LKDERVLVVYWWVGRKGATAVRQIVPSPQRPTRLSIRGQEAGGEDEARWETIVQRNEKNYLEMYTYDLRKLEEKKEKKENWKEKKN